MLSSNFTQKQTKTCKANSLVFFPLIKHRKIITFLFFFLTWLRGYLVVVCIHLLCYHYDAYDIYEIPIFETVYNKR